MHCGKTTSDISIVLLVFIHTFMTGNFNPKLSKGFEALAI